MPNKLEILQIFEDGIPCRSKLLPEFIMNAWEVKSRPSEIMVGFCKVRKQHNCLNSYNVKMFQEKKYTITGAGNISDS